MIQAETPPVAGALDPARVSDFVGRTYTVDPMAVELDIRPLRGGLEATGVARVNAHFRDATVRPRTATFVVKPLDGAARREADLYGVLSGPVKSLAPRLIGVDVVSPDRVHLYLEYIRAARAWPWQELSPTGSVLKGLARLHASVADLATGAALLGWDYELELGGRALWTLSMFERAVSADPGMLSGLRRYGPALRRLVLNLARVRAELLRATPFGATVLHGDVHQRRGQGTACFSWQRNARARSALGTSRKPPPPVMNDLRCTGLV